MNSLTQIEIPKRSTHCAYQKERFVPGMEIYSLLLEDEAKRLTRHDFCAECWIQKQAQEKSLERHSYWKSKIEQRKQPIESSRLSRAWALLQELLQAPKQQEAEIFVLCLFLARARHIALRREYEKEGNVYHFYEALQQEEYMTVKALPLTDLQLEEIQASLASKLQF